MRWLPKAKLPSYAALPDVMRDLSIEAHVDIHKRYEQQVRVQLRGWPASGSLVELIDSPRNSPELEQLYSHNMWWQSLDPDGGGPPPRIVQRFLPSGCPWPRLRNMLVEQGTAHVGSGWLWLTLDRWGELRPVVTVAANVPSLLFEGMPERVISAIDLWEHAYYLDWTYHRDEYLQRVLDRAINWRYIEHRLAASHRLGTGP